MRSMSLTKAERNRRMITSMPPPQISSPFDPKLPSHLNNVSNKFCYCLKKSLVSKVISDESGHLLY